MSTDRELLEAAAKAAGLDGARYQAPEGWFETRYGLTQAMWHESTGYWNPLEDDGDALRLAVKLRLLLNISSAHTEVRWYDEARSETFEIEQWDNGMTPDEWTRRAIVRAAAAIGAA